MATMNWRKLLGSILLCLLARVAVWGAAPGDASILPWSLVQEALRWQVMGAEEGVPCEALMLTLEEPVQPHHISALRDAGYAVSSASGLYVNVLAPITRYLDKELGRHELGFVRSALPYLGNWQNLDWQGWTDEEMALCMACVESTTSEIDDPDAQARRDLELACTDGDGRQAVFLNEVARAQDLLGYGELATRFAGIDAVQVDRAAIDAAITEIQRSLLPSEAVFQYMVVGEFVYLCVVTGSTISAPIQVSEDLHQLSADTIGLRRDLENPLPSSRLRVMPALALLYEQLVQPGLAVLEPEVTTLVIVPDGPMWHLPFAALTMTDRGEISDGFFSTRLPHLVERYDVAVLPRFVDALRVMDGLELDDPSFAGFCSVPGGLAGPWEVRLADLLDRLAVCVTGEAASQSAVYVGADATRENMLMAATEARVLALFCLVDASPYAPASSLLLFGEDPGERVSAWELLTLSPHATELVILLQGGSQDFRDPVEVLHHPLPVFAYASAKTAETVDLTDEGWQQRLSGDDVRAFPETILAAGAKCVLQPLWAVNPDAFDALLMSMCQHHQAGMTWGKAMNEAQRDLINHAVYSDVWFWAPFQMMGY